MKILTWNINLGSSLGWNGKKEISKDVVDTVFEKENNNKFDADIVVLTEFTILKGWDYLQDKMLDCGYIWFVTNIPGDNGILICVKKELISDKDKTKFINRIYDNSSGAVQFSNEKCNLLKITLPLKSGEDLTIIGFRMKTGGLTGQACYDSERETFYSELLPHIESVRNECIVCGDFNNGRCLGDLNKTYDEKDYTGMVQRNYNLNIIKDDFSRFGFQMLDKKSNSGIGCSFNTWKCVPGKKTFVPDDHIFVRFNNKTKVSKVEAVDTAYSDHSLLWAKIESDE